MLERYRAGTAGAERLRVGPLGGYIDGFATRLACEGAIEDGYIVARAFDEHTNVETALARYEEARRERTTRMVLGSNDNARRFHNPALAEPAGAQAYVDREWSEERVKDRYEWLFAYDVATVAV